MGGLFLDALIEPGLVLGPELGDAGGLRGRGYLSPVVTGEHGWALGEMWVCIRGFVFFWGFGLIWIDLESIYVVWIPNVS